MRRACFWFATVTCLVISSLAVAEKPSVVDRRPRIFVQAFKTAESFALPEKCQGNADSRSVALGKSYLVGRLVKTGRPFSVVDDEKRATHDLVSVVSTLRSRENTFRGATYGVETKTTKWLLDLILSLKDRSTGEMVWAKTVCSTCEEQRPISASQFDNNVFHSLMISAVEEAAEALVEHFEPSGEEVASSGGGASWASPVARGGTAGATRPSAVPESAKPALAILRPDFRNGVTENEAVMLWGYMESCVDGTAFRVLSRADVSRQMEEVAITTSSYLTDPSCREKARVGKLATVSKLLAASIGRVGEKFVVTFKVFDASTGEIEASRTDNAMADALEDLLPVIRTKMAKVLAPAPSGTVLEPVVLRLGNPPDYLASEFNGRLEAALSHAGIAYKAGSPGARRLVPAVTAFSIRAVQDGDGFVYRGTVSFSISLTDAAGTPLVAPAAVSLADVELGRETGAAPPWLTAQYGKRLLDAGFRRLSVVSLSGAFAK